VDTVGQCYAISESPRRDYRTRAKALCLEVLRSPPVLKSRPSLQRGRGLPEEVVPAEVLGAAPLHDDYLLDKAASEGEETTSLHIELLGLVDEESSALVEDQVGEGAHAAEEPQKLANWLSAVYLAPNRSLMEARTELQVRSNVDSRGATVSSRSSLRAEAAFMVSYSSAPTCEIESG
jgi:hypothetical protein